MLPALQEYACYANHYMIISAYERFGGSRFALPAPTSPNFLLPTGWYALHKNRCKSRKPYCSEQPQKHRKAMRSNYCGRERVSTRMHDITRHHVLATKRKAFVCELVIWALSSLLSVTLYAGVVAQRRFSVAEAEHLVTVWAKKHRVFQTPKVARLWHNGHFLKESTPEHCWERLGIQVFQPRGLIEAVSEVPAMLIEDAKVYPLDTGEASTGMTSLCVCNINRNGRLGLAYTYACGSGRTRSELAILSLPPDVAAKPKVLLEVQLAELFLEKQNGQYIRIYASPIISPGEPHPRILLGRLVLSQKKKRSYLHVVLDAKIPNEWRQRTFVTNP